MSKYLELVQDSFTQEHLDKQENQKPYVAYSIKDDNVIYNIVPKEDSDMWIITAIRLKDISNCTYNMVDLGLPSGLKWADRNVGASSPEHYGSYFQWGDTNAYTFEKGSEVTTEQLFDILGPVLGDGATVDDLKNLLLETASGGNDLTGMGIISLDKQFTWESYFDTNDGGSTFNKYNETYIGTIIEVVDDAAYIHMGPAYKTPTKDQYQELMSNTTPIFVDLNGQEFTQEEAQNKAIKSGNLKGVKLISNVNGNSIFLPAAGLVLAYAVQDLARGGVYGTSELDEWDISKSILQSFHYYGDWGKSSTNRYFGIPIRGVEFKL
jgi:hypothetical protein